MLKNICIIWLWEQGQKYLKYFQKPENRVFWVCQSSQTQDFIEHKYNIWVSRDSQALLKQHEFDVIVICIPVESQWRVWYEIARKYPHTRIIIDIPVSWNLHEIQQLCEYDNLYFFCEEYMSLLSGALQSFKKSDISNIAVTISCALWDYNNHWARRVSYIHILNNFLWIELDYTSIDIDFVFHDSPDIYYRITMQYKNTSVIYVFDHDWAYLEVWNKKWKDSYCFDRVLEKILVWDFDNHVLKKNYARMCHHVYEIC